MLVFISFMFGMGMLIVVCYIRSRERGNFDEEGNRIVEIGVLFGRGSILSFLVNWVGEIERILILELDKCSFIS